MANTDCIFCKIIDKEIPSSVIAESGDVLVIKDRAPKAPVHYLIIPKKHIKDIASLDADSANLAAKALLMAGQVAQGLPGSKDFRLLVNNGPSVGQTVFHLHFHFLAGATMVCE